MKLKKTIAITEIKKNVLSEKCGITYRQLTYLLESENQRKPLLDTITQVLGVELISQFVIDKYLHFAEDIHLSLEE